VSATGVVDDQLGAAVAVEDELLDGCLVHHWDLPIAQGAVVVVDQGLAAAEEEAVGASHVQGPGEGGLEECAALGHPARDALGLAHGEVGQLLVGGA
jgi:hypothetical protein